MTALDRLILAEAVCRAAEAFQRVVDDVLITKADSELARPLRLALDAWTKGKPS